MVTKDREVTKPSSASKSSQESATQGLERIRDQVLNKALITIALVVPLLVAISLFRTLDSGWMPVYWLHLTLTSMLLAGALFRRRLPYNVRAFLIIGAAFLTGAFGLLTFGLVGGDFVFLALGIFLTNQLLSTRAGLFATGLALLLIASTGLAINTGMITLSIDVDTYSTSITAWLIVIVSFLFIGLIIVTTTDSARRYLVETLKGLETNERKYRTIFQNLHDVYIETSLDGTILEVSPSLENFSIYRREELVGTNIEKLYAIPEQRAQYLTELLTKKKVNDYKADIIDRDGRIIPCSIMATIYYDPALEQNKICATVRDISEHKEAEEQRELLEAGLRQNQKMEAIGTLAGGIAHDFNNILSAILGFTQLSQLYLNDPKKLEGNLSEILRATNRATKLVKQILAFSRQDEEKSHPFQVSHIVKEAAQLLRSSIPTSIPINKDISSDALILADPTQIHQVVMNLCTNAYHAMRESGGTLSISLKDVTPEERVHIQELSEAVGDYVELRVSDTGIGIDEETLSKIFEPYFTTKEQEEGTGLGLAVVHGVLQSYGAITEIESQLGEGTTFHIFLPVYKGSESSRPSGPAKAQTPIGGNETIMLVDDEKAIVEITQEYLERFGYNVQGFTNGVQAFQEFEREPDKYDLVLTDMTMPYMTGSQLALKILETQPQMPIILCTGQSDAINREQALAIGIKEYLEKPLNIDTMLGTIRKVLDGAKKEAL